MVNEFPYVLDGDFLPRVNSPHEPAKFYRQTDMDHTVMQLAYRHNSRLRLSPGCWPIRVNQRESVLVLVIVPLKAKIIKVETCFSSALL